MDDRIFMIVMIMIAIFIQCSSLLNPVDITNSCSVPDFHGRFDVFSATEILLHFTSSVSKTIPARLSNYE